MSSKSYMVVDIGNKNTKILSGGIRNDKYFISEYEIMPTPANCVKDGKIVEINSIIKMIKQFQDIHRDKYLLLTIGGTGLITREIQLPKSSNEEIEKILQFEAQQYFPVDLQNYSFDFRVIEEYDNDTTKMCRILLVAVPLRQVDEYMKLHEELKMEMEAIDITANTVPKSIFHFSSQIIQSYPNAFAILDIGSETSIVYIFLNKKLRFSRMMLNGSTGIDMAISTKIEVDYNSAEESKKRYAKIIFEEESIYNNNEDKILSDLLKDGFDSIATDVTKFFDFYYSRDGSERIDKVFLCGGGSKVDGLERFLSQSFQVPVEYIYPFDNIEYKGKKSNQKFEEDRVFLVGAMGCLVREGYK